MLPCQLNNFVKLALFLMKEPPVKEALCSVIYCSYGRLNVLTRKIAIWSRVTGESGQ